MTTLLADREIERLMALHPKGYDLSLDRIARLLDRLGNPQRNLPPVIHIAGTNGKGSAAAFSRAVLEEAGFRVHVHTSPHLVNWHERYRLAAEGGGRFVDDRLLAETIARVAAANHGFHVPKRSGHTDTEVLAELADRTASWSAEVVAARS